MRRFVALVLVVPPISLALAGCGGTKPDPTAREVAEWVLSKRGTVHTTASEREVKPGMPLPEGEFGLVRVNLNEITLTDNDLKRLSGLKNVRYLGLHRAEITDAGLDHLTGLTTLRELELSYNRITDLGLDKIKAFTRLEKLYLYNTDVTDEGVQAFQRQMDDVTVYR